MIIFVALLGTLQHVSTYERITEYRNLAASIDLKERDELAFAWDGQRRTANLNRTLIGSIVGDDVIPPPQGTEPEILAMKIGEDGTWSGPESTNIDVRRLVRIFSTLLARKPEMKFEGGHLECKLQKENQAIQTWQVTYEEPKDELVFVGTAVLNSQTQRIVSFQGKAPAATLPGGSERAELLMIVYTIPSRK